MKLELEATDEVIKSKLLALNHPRDVADLLEVDYKTLLYYLYRKGTSKNYFTFKIKKKSGEDRIIHAPQGGLKIIQKKLNYILRLVYKPNNSSFGFCRGRSIKDNANFHSGQKFILNLDIENFFPTIHFGRVRGLFMGKKFKYNKSVASTLAHICCYRENEHGFLPQGAPTSPIISNLICHGLDLSLSSLAKNNSCLYSRYADDITFSSRKYFTENILKKRLDYYDKSLSLGDELVSIIQKNQFTINNKKTRLRGKGDQQEVTGLIINKGTNVNRRFIKHIRAVLYDWERNTYSVAQNNFFSKHDNQKFSSDKDLSKVINGKINFIKMIRGYSYVHNKLYNKYNLLTANGKARLPENRVEDIGRYIWVVECDDDYVGTAFMLDGYGFVTCNHVIKDKKKVYIYNHMDKRREVKIVNIKYSEEHDLAVLQPDNQKSWDALKISPEQIQISNKLIVCGFPDYVPHNSLNIAGAEIEGYQSVTPIRYSLNPPLYSGNSGGPALDKNDKVIGVAAFGWTLTPPKPGTIKNPIPGIVPISFIENYDDWKIINL